MAEKVLNTRIQLKYDTYANWHEKNNILKKGEIAIVEIAAAQDAVSQVPAIMMKIGNGTSTFDQLPWSKALSADVYDWAKAATKPEYDASEIKNLSTYISGQIEDTDTQYKLEQDVSDGHILKFYTKSKDGDWGTPTTITIPDDTSVQSNWNQNDPDAKDYVKNRTHYEESSTVVVAHVDSDAEWEKDWYMGERYCHYISTPNVTLTLGETYHINIGGKTYTLECTECFISQTVQNVFGFNLPKAVYTLPNGADLTEDLPFCMYVYEDNNDLHIDLLMDYIPDPVDVTITKDVLVTHPLDEKYLPVSARRFVITLTEDDEGNLSADKTYAEIREAWESGEYPFQNICVAFNRIIYPLHKLPPDDNPIIFMDIWSNYADSGILLSKEAYPIIVSSDDSWLLATEIYSYELCKPVSPVFSGIPIYTPSNGWDVCPVSDLSQIFSINFTLDSTSNTWSADTTWESINIAYNAGKLLIGHYGNELFIGEQNSESLSDPGYLFTNANHSFGLTVSSINSIELSCISTSSTLEYKDGSNTLLWDGTFPITQSAVTIDSTILYKGHEYHYSNLSQWGSSLCYFEAFSIDESTKTLLRSIMKIERNPLQSSGIEVSEFAPVLSSVSYALPQELTAEQKAQARENIDALDINYGLTPVKFKNFIPIYANQTFTCYLKEGTFNPITDETSVTTEVKNAWNQFTLGLISAVGRANQEWIKNIGILIENGIFGNDFFNNSSKVILYNDKVCGTDPGNEIKITITARDSATKTFYIIYYTSNTLTFSTEYSISNDTFSDYCSYYSTYLRTYQAKWTDTPTLTQVAMKSDPTSDMQIATKQYVDNSTAGLTGAMHFRGTSTTDPAVSGPTIPDITTYESGDVVLYGSKEFVYDGTTWKELGDEGSHVLKTQTINGHALTGNITLTVDDIEDAVSVTAANYVIGNLAQPQIGGETSYISTISQTDGKISAAAKTMPTALKNPNALTFGSKNYDGSAAQSITLDDLIDADILVFNCGGAI